MKKNIILISLILIICSITNLTGQNVIEIKKPEISKLYFDVMKKTKELEAQNSEESVRLYTDALASVQGEYERFNIIFWGLSFVYSKMGLFQNSLDIMLKGQEEGLYFPIRTGERKWPAFVEELEELNGFSNFIEENNRLRSSDQLNAKTEYFVRLPEKYNQEKTFPLLIVLTGGFGSHLGLSKDWYSQQLTSDYIVAYTHGNQCQGSYLFSYDRENYKKNIRTIYDQVVQKYSVDTSRVILGGPSAGGARSLILTLDGIIPARGLLLGFPVIPREMDENKIKKTAESGLRLAMITGENDFGLKKQKEAAVLFDKHELPNRFLIYPEKGHEYPDDFTYQIDLSLDFIFKK